jgi:hypothetical protein
MYLSLLIDLFGPLLDSDESLEIRMKKQWRIYYHGSDFTEENRLDCVSQNTTAVLQE